jgi:hypothetical protein
MIGDYLRGQSLEHGARHADTPVMAKLDQVLRHERHERKLGYWGAAGLLLVIVLVVVAWIQYL